MNATTTKAGVLLHHAPPVDDTFRNVEVLRQLRKGFTICWHGPAGAGRTRPLGLVLVLVLLGLALRVAGSRFAFEIKGGHKDLPIVRASPFRSPAGPYLAVSDQFQDLRGRSVEPPGGDLKGNGSDRRLCWQ